jgi:NAD kinase
MLSTMRKYHKHQKPFIWYNCWTLGFLMNNLDNINQLPNTIEQMTTVSSKIFAIEVTDNEWNTHETYCINDVTIGNSVMDYFSLNVKTQEREKTIQWTWLVLATSIWATGYVLNLGIPLIPLESKLRCLAWIATHPFKFSCIQPQKITIQATCKSKRNIWCDWHAQIFKDVKQIEIMPSDQEVTLWFCPQEDFITKRVLLAEQKLG